MKASQTFAPLLLHHHQSSYFLFILLLTSSLLISIIFIQILYSLMYAINAITLPSVPTCHHHDTSLSLNMKEKNIPHDDILQHHHSLFILYIAYFFSPKLSVQSNTWEYIFNYIAFNCCIYSVFEYESEKVRLSKGVINQSNNHNFAY